MRLLVLGWLVFGLPAISLGTSIDYSSKGSIGAGTATLKGSARDGGSLSLSSPLVSVNSLVTAGTVVITTGTLTATSNSSVFDFGSGSVSIESGGSTLFHGTFSSGTVTILGNSIFSINGKLDNGAFITLTDRHGDVTSDTVVTPELDSLRLTATGLGLIAVAGLMRRKRHYFSLDSVMRYKLASHCAQLRRVRVDS